MHVHNTIKQSIPQYTAACAFFHRAICIAIIVYAGIILGILAAGAILELFQNNLGIIKNR